MQIEFQDQKMVIIPEDIRDELYLANVLNISAGKLFIRVGKHEGKWADTSCIEISKFVERTGDSKPNGSYRVAKSRYPNPPPVLT